MRLSSAVGPPLIQWMMWWPSVHAGGRSHPGKRQPWSRTCSAVRICAGMVRVARPTESGITRVPAIATESAGGAIVTTVRTASQAIRRAVSGWIGPTPQLGRLCIGAGAQRVGVHRDREVGPLPVHIAVVTVAQLGGGE